MTGVWALIIMLAGNGSAGVAVDHVTFASQSLCEAAQRVILEEWDQATKAGIRARAICVPRKT
jgi:hypothetical protein